MHLRRKLAIVTHVVPPATFGSAVRLWRLFRDTPVEDYCIVTCRDLPAGGTPSAAVRVASDPGTADGPFFEGPGGESLAAGVAASEEYRPHSPGGVRGDDHGFEWRPL
jgi:hypothetical protein